MEQTQKTKKKTSLGKKILIGVGIFIIIGIIGSSLDKDKKDASSSTSSEPAVQLTPAQQAEEIKKQTISAKDLTASYEANEVSADNNFKDKTFYVSGTVTDIKKDIMDNIYVTLEGDQMFRQVQCFFEDKETAGKLQKGMEVVFKGRCEGLMMNVLMKDCELISVQ